MGADYLKDFRPQRSLKIQNGPRRQFMLALLAIQRGAYEVEDLADGQKICIRKPGYKGGHDFVVIVYTPAAQAGFALAHEQAARDVLLKVSANREIGLRVVKALRRVHDGEDPVDILTAQADLGKGLPGMSVELILKAYKWIFGQEDCNYPDGQGRSMFMNGIEAKCMASSEA